eukprot:CAMPEP_0178938322 /NCGR_PEP_ID=MMETSP0786-20121207/26265_1 /TAXON_ID=186022 /ORGANISM="Thalassionema frauenfeldii, Strain CCMP 1798" /LENGTH=371 /DNA_ID=CAMNT_0020617025 /DNA_START=2470 /DNA_END=3582 /DNA_ORIENTATION=+
MTISSDTEFNLEEDNAARRAQRRLLLFAVAYRQVMNQRESVSSRSTSSDENRRQPVDPLPLRILSDEEAREKDAKCRFCLEGIGSGTQLVAPCACAGSAEYVHVACLRQWQRLARNKSSASVCSICTIPYSLPPPPPKKLLPIPKGTLLIRKGQQQEGRTFSRSVVLLLCGTQDDELPFGVIINLPIIRHNIAVEDSNNTTVKKRKGGPVCGGRFGVTRFIMLLLQQATTTANDEDEHRWSMIPVLNIDNDVADVTTLSLLCDDDSVYERENSSLLESEQVQEWIESSSFCNTPPTENTLFVFSGYCKWARGQLEREIQRGDWDLCHGKEEDILRSDDNVESLWNELSSQQNDGRLIPLEELYEEDNDESL